MQSTLVIIKPNGVKGGIIGEIVERYEKARLAVRALKMKYLARKEVEGFYAEHREKGFFGELVDFMTSGPVVLMVLTGNNAIEAVRNINGATNPTNAAPGTIRHDFAPNTGENIVHSSDSPQSAAREIEFWFTAQELVEYTPFSHIRR